MCRVHGGRVDSRALDGVRGAAHRSDAGRSPPPPPLDMPSPRRLRLETRAAGGSRRSGLRRRVDVPTSVFWNDGGWSLSDFEPIRTRRAGEGRSDVARREAVRARPGAVRWMSRTPSTRWWREVRLKASRVRGRSSRRQRCLEGLPGDLRRRDGPGGVARGPARQSTRRRPWM